MKPNNSEYPRQKAKKVHIIGDSHSADLLMGFALNGAPQLQRLGIQYRCQPVFGPGPVENGRVSSVVTTAEEAKNCEDRFNRILNTANVKRADVLMMSPRWKDCSIQRLGETIKAIRERNQTARIILFGTALE